MSETTTTAPKKKSFRIWLWLVGFLLIIIGGCVAYTWASLTWAFSEGERAGIVQKFSKKGWVCKTWEGEIVLPAMQSATLEKFLFTVHDETVAKTINDNMGKKLTLSYEEHKGIPLSCFGDTPYFITAVKVD